MGCVYTGVLFLQLKTLECSNSEQLPAEWFPFSMIILVDAGVLWKQQWLEKIQLNYLNETI